MMRSPPTQTKLRRADALWGQRPNAEWTKPKMRLVSWKPLVNGSLLGFASIELPIGLKIFDVPVLVGKNGAWASLPSKPRLDRDRRQKTDINGKPAYTAILEWRDRALSSRFSNAVVALIREVHPGDLGDGGAT